MKTHLLILVAQSLNKLLVCIFLCALFHTAFAQEPISIGIAPNDQACHTPDIYPQEAQHYPWFGVLVIATPTTFYTCPVL